MKNAIITVLVLIIVGIGGYYVYLHGVPHFSDIFGSEQSEIPTGTNTNNPVATSTQQSSTASSNLAANESVIGKSVQGRNIGAFTYGSGDKKVVFVGGIHGGYEWNTSLVAYQLMDYLDANPSAVPAGIQVVVIPVLNPDGLYKVVGTEGRFSAADVPASQSVQVAGRFNASGVDLNRNFDCDWQPSGMWQNTAVDGGTAVFSEPESSAFRDFVTTSAPTAVVGFYSAAGGVYASSCDGPVLSTTKTLTSTYANASGYTAHQSFDSYPITGDMENWLAKMKIPAISVLLTNHQDTEWDKNLAGIKALLAYLAK